MRAAGSATSPRRRAAVVVLSAWGLFSTWAILVPPFQVPDEPVHALRATSVLAQPWIAGGDRFVLDPRHANPMARDLASPLRALIFHRERALDREDVRLLRAHRWDDAPPSGPAAAIERSAAASYAPVYHLAVFAVAEPVTGALALTPYQSTYAYRLVSAICAALVWGLAYGVLERSAGPERAARAIALLLAIPMLAFASSGINPDAVAIPLAAAALAAAWRLARTGEGALLAGGLLFAAALAKPTSLPVVAAVAAAAPVAGLLGGTTPRRAALVAGVAVAAIVAAWLVFYAWSPPRFLGSGPAHATWLEWAASLARRAHTLWAGYWGLLGWVDYRLPIWWYAALGVVVALNAVLAARWLAAERDAVFLPTVAAGAAVVIVAGEFVTLSSTGYNLQGRHFLTGALGLAPLVWHPSRWAWATLLGFLAAMQARFFWETFVRYYGADPGVLWAALPFT